MTKKIGTVLMAAAFSALFALCIAFGAIRALGLGTYIVTGGSMEPNIRKGSLVLVQPASPSEVKVGDVITFQQYGQTTTHRVISIGRNSGGLTFQTRGDANVVADPEDKSFPGAVGVVRGAIPLAGYVVFGIQAYWRLALTLLAAVIFFGCASALIFRKSGAKPARPIAPRPVQRRPALVAVDVDSAWNAHIEWVRSSRRKTLVA